MAQGKLIVIDGIDGSGKTTQVERLLEHLLESPYDVVKISFPQYGTKSAGLIENYLNGKYGAAGEVHPYIASFFYMLDRYDASFMLRQWLEEGKVVITDRYVSANMGHQGGQFDTVHKRREYFRWLDHYEYNVFKIPRPDVTFVLDIPYEEARARMRARPDKSYIENGNQQDILEESLEHLKKAHEAYREMSQIFPHFELVQCYDGERMFSVDEVSRVILEKVIRLLRAEHEDRT